MSLGIVLDDRFDLRRRVGMGAMGFVYEAWDRQAGRPVAVKILRTRSHAGARRFMQEGAILAELDHPAIVRYVAHGTGSEGEPYLVMEWLEGETLEERLQSGPLGIAEVLTMAARVLDGLAVAHQRGVVHRDLKPSNVFLPGGVIADAKILDFGIAWRVWDHQRLTLAGTVLGTPLYMSPEQARGDDHVDERADIYSLGAMLFECLTGTPPFTGSSAMAILCKICVEEPPRLRTLVPDAPVELDALLASMLAKDPDLRPRGAFALASAVAASPGSLSPMHSGVPPQVKLTEGEQRVLCAIFVGNPSNRPGESATDRTITLAPVDEALLEDAVQDALSPHGAHLEHLVDRSMMITFPRAEAPTDQAAGAARCALALRALLADLPLAVCTGRGRMHGRLPIGDVIDRGVALLQDSLPGLIAVDTMTAGLLDARFEIDGAAGGLYLRTEREFADASRTVMGKAVPCLGREPELALLEGIFASVVAEREAQCVLISAPAGMGKSRLRQELISRLQHRGERFELFVGRADPSRTGSPFGLIAPSIRWAMGISGEDSVESRRHKLQARVARHLPDDRVRRIAEFLGELAGIPFGDEASAALRAARKDARLMGDQMRAAWLDWLDAECAVSPVLVVLEDVHWSDAPSVQLVDAALRALRDRPFMVLALARPEVSSRFPHLWEDRGLRTYPLLPLSRKTCEKFVVEVFGNDARSELIARVVNQADGNPFFLEELLRGVAVGQTQLPETVLGMVQSRLDGLGADAGRVLRAASVFGQTFNLQGVQSLLGQVGKHSLEESLQSLIEREVIQPRGGSGKQEFVFRHALVREASYATLIEGDRVLGHRLAGEWLEGIGEMDAMVMADHYNRGADRARAAAWYARAGGQALQADDLDAALACVERAVGCGAAGETLRETSLVEAQARYWRGELAAAAVSARRAIEHAESASAPWFHAIRELVGPVVDDCGPDEIVLWAKAAYEAAPTTEEAVEAQVACLSWCGGALANFGQSALATMLLERAGTALAALPTRDPWVVLRFHLAKGILLAWSGSLMEAIEHLELALNASEQGGDSRMTCFIRCELGFYWTEMGDPERGEGLVKQVLADAKQRSLETIEAFTLPVLAHALIAMGRLEEARRTLERSLELAAKHGSAWTLGLASSVFSTLAYVEGDWIESERRARIAEESLRSSPGPRLAALAALARALLRQGRKAEAFDAAHEATALLDAVGGTKDYESLIRLMGAETTMAMGDESGATAAIGVARERLLERADRITNTKIRTTFLTRVVDNARTLELAQAWGCSGRSG